MSDRVEDEVESVVEDARAADAEDADDPDYAEELGYVEDPDDSVDTDTDTVPAKANLAKTPAKTAAGSAAKATGAKKAGAKATGTKTTGTKTTGAKATKAASARSVPARAPSARAVRRAEQRKIAAERAAAERRRRQAAIGVIVALLAVGIVAAFMLTRGNGSDNKATPSASASLPPGVAAGPQLPISTPPALAAKPAASAGTGSLTALKVTTLVEGTGPAVRNGQKITVNYVGVKWADGTEFDSSWQRNEPFSFTVGQGGVIKGWDQGLLDVKVGSRVQLDIPSDLAYGDSGQVPGPLRFIVDVLAAQ